VNLVLPATSANLGPAFDAAALAFNLFLRVRARESESFAVTATGRDTNICERIDNHLILTTYREVLKEEGKPVVPLALEIDNQIPIGKGCGSSAAARLAGIALAVRFGKLNWDDKQIISEASNREHHPDNASACWVGGVTVASSSGSDTTIANIRPKKTWPLLLAVPENSLSTEDARRALPSQYSRADVVANIQNCLLLMAAFVNGRPDLIRSSLRDRIHQPYRASLCKLLAPLQALAGTQGILGACLSGAGPSVLMFLNPRSSVTHAKHRAADELAANGLSAELIPAAITHRGARLSFNA
jgi:homoserine kinase